MTQTYFHTVSVGFDDYCASVLLNRNDITISAACGLVRRGASADAPLQLHGWQRWFLTVVGAALEFFFRGHCERAIANDIFRGKSLLALLGSPTS